MATAEVEQPPAEAAPALPDYLLDPDAVLGDQAQWRYGKAPDYSNTRKVYAATKTQNHEAGSLPSLVENLVKNWEIEASFKPTLSDWRTISPHTYTFAINGGPPQTAEHMLNVGTYNAIISSKNEYYDPANSDFATSHKTFKRMMPTFAWEVLEVYSGPPTVAFRWRHWGEMKGDYVGFNDKGEKVSVAAHGGKIDIQGVTVAKVDDKLRLERVETWFDPLEMFRQIAPNGIVNKVIVDPVIKTPVTKAEDSDITGESKGDDTIAAEKVEKKESEEINLASGKDVDVKETPTTEAPAETTKTEETSLETSPPETKEKSIIEPETLASKVDEPGSAIVAPADSEEAKLTHEEMSKITPAECPFLMNKE